MKNKLILVLYCLLWTVCAYGNDAPLLKIKVLVVDDEGKPVEGAKVGLSGVVGSKPNSGGGFPENVYGNDEALTNKEGGAELEVGSLSPEYGLNVHKSGFYNGDVKEPKVKLQGNEWISEVALAKVIIKRIKRPVAMYVKEVEALVEKGGMGYDFMIGDWLPPHGKGKIADLKVNLVKRDINVETGYDVQVEVTFSNEHDGVIVWTADHGINSGSVLKSSQEAPIEGYEKLRKLYSRKKVGGDAEQSDSMNTNYYFRVRTKIDSHGNVKRAHYGKIYKGLNLGVGARWPKSTLRFLYYFNPISNDRSVEYAPRKNLMKSENRSFRP